MAKAYLFFYVNAFVLRVKGKACMEVNLPLDPRRKHPSQTKQLGHSLGPKERG